MTKEEIYALSPLYSFSKDLLIFPIYDMDKNLLMWQGRYFGESQDHPKWLTYGAKDVLHILGPDSDRIVCVEDLISAAKVSSVTTVMPLFGSNIGLGLATRLSKRFKWLTVWLDMDKAKESLKTRLKLSGLFENISCVVTPLDPKEYNHDQIKEFLNEYK